MANIKSQIKRIKTNEKARQRNKAVKSALKTAIRRTREAVAVRRRREGRRRRARRVPQARQGRQQGRHPQEPGRQQEVGAGSLRRCHSGLNRCPRASAGEDQSGPSQPPRPGTLSASRGPHRTRNCVRHAGAVVTNERLDRRPPHRQFPGAGAFGLFFYGQGEPSATGRARTVCHGARRPRRCGSGSRGGGGAAGGGGRCGGGGGGGGAVRAGGRCERGPAVAAGRGAAVSAGRGPRSGTDWGPRVGAGGGPRSARAAGGAGGGGRGSAGRCGCGSAGRCRRRPAAGAGGGPRSVRDAGQPLVQAGSVVGAGRGSSR